MYYLGKNELKKFLNQKAFKVFNNIDLNQRSLLNRVHSWLSVQSAVHDATAFVIGRRRIAITFISESLARLSSGTWLSLRMSGLASMTLSSSARIRIRLYR